MRQDFNGQLKQVPVGEPQSSRCRASAGHMAGAEGALVTGGAFIVLNHQRRHLYEGSAKEVGLVMQALSQVQGDAAQLLQLGRQALVHVMAVPVVHPAPAL